MKEIASGDNIEAYRFVNLLVEKMHAVLGKNLTGLYLHGSLALGGFQDHSSDIDLIGITEEPMAKGDAEKLTMILLAYSAHPFPVEISFLNKNQLTDWVHPSRFDFHFSEQWRNYFESQVSEFNAFIFQNMKDEDLAAHLKVINHRGICLLGKPINEVFPLIPDRHYVSSILGDFRSCLENIEREPVYCTLNMLRVYRYLRDYQISSKLEAGKWAQDHLPEVYKETIQLVINRYQLVNNNKEIATEELTFLKEHIKAKTEKLISRY